MFTRLYKYNDPNKYRSRGESAQERLQKCKDIKEEEEEGCGVGDEPTWREREAIPRLIGMEWNGMEWAI